MSYLAFTPNDSNDRLEQHYAEINAEYGHNDEDEAPKATTPEERYIARLKAGEAVLDVQHHWVALLKVPQLRLTQEFVARHHLRVTPNPFRHPCGEFLATWEKQYHWGTDASQRQEIEREMVRRREGFLIEPTDKMLEIVSSKADIETKKAAYQQWIAESADVMSPTIMTDNPRSRGHFFGWAWYATQTYFKVQRAAEFKAYQVELRDGQIARRKDLAPIEVTMKWLQRNAVKASKKRLAPELKAELEERLKIVGWSMSKYKREMRERKWVK